MFRRRISCPWHSPACPGWECKHTGSLEEVHTWGSEHHSEVGAGGLWSSLGSQILGCNPNLLKKKRKQGKGNEVKRRKGEIQVTLERRNPADEVVPSWNTYSDSQFYWDSSLTIPGCRTNFCCCWLKLLGSIRLTHFFFYPRLVRFHIWPWKSAEQSSGGPRRNLYPNC